MSQALSLPPPHPSLSHTEVPRGRFPLKQGYQEQGLPHGTQGKTEITQSLWVTGTHSEGGLQLRVSARTALPVFKYLAFLWEREKHPFVTLS